MKKLFLIVGIILISLTGSDAQSLSQAPSLKKVKWMNWDEGYSTAQQQEKVIMLDLYTDWCGWCKKMDRETFADAEIVEIINSYFIPIKLNPEKKDQKFIYKGMEVNSKQLLKLLSNETEVNYPAILFYFPDYNVVFTETGFQKPKSFKHLLKLYASHYEKLNAKAQE
ncbi:MAG: DUF255 domain-containing protein [Bacteroidetes bacterium]|nr:DUF255 domain-containing protein [Bacteroidota bacterium]